MKYRFNKLHLLLLLSFILIGCQNVSMTSSDPNVIDAGSPNLLAMDHGFVYRSNNNSIDYFDINKDTSVKIISASLCDGLPLEGDMCQGNLERISSSSGFFTDDSERIYVFTEYYGEEGQRKTQLLRMNQDGQKLVFNPTDIEGTIQAAVQMKGDLYVIEQQESMEKTLVKRLSMQGRLLEEIEFPGKVIELIPDADKLYFRQGEPDVFNQLVEFYDTEQKTFGQTSVKTAGYMRVLDGNIIAVERDESVDYTQKEAFFVVLHPLEGESVVLENNAGNVFLLDDEIITTHTGLEALDQKLQRTVYRYEMDGTKKGEFSVGEGHEVVGVSAGHLICLDHHDEYHCYSLKD